MFKGLIWLRNVQQNLWSFHTRSELILGRGMHGIPHFYLLSRDFDHRTRVCPAFIPHKICWGELANNPNIRSFQRRRRTSVVCRFECSVRNALEAKRLVINLFETQRLSEGAVLPIVCFEWCFRFLLKTSFFVDFF